MLYLYRRICYGEQKNADAAAMPDLSAREIWPLAPIAAAVLWMGVYPDSFLAPMRPDIPALEARHAPAPPPGDANHKVDALAPVTECGHARGGSGCDGTVHSRVAPVPNKKQ